MRSRIVIKLGGSSLQNPITVSELALLIQGYRKKRYDVVVVHGGGPAINQELTKRGLEWRFIAGQRQTTSEMMMVIEQVLSCDVNSKLVADLQNNKIAAIGLSGASDRILRCTQASPELICVGKIESVDVSAIEIQLARFGRYIPVISPVGFGDEIEKYNVNADWAAAQIAIALKAKKLIYLTDQEGILDADRKLIHRADPKLIDKMIVDGTISKGMYTKVKAMLMGFDAGIKQVRVLHASQASQILQMAESKTTGTLLIQSPAQQPQTQKDMMHGRAG